MTICAARRWTMPRPSTPTRRLWRHRHIVDASNVAVHPDVTVRLGLRRFAVRLGATQAYDRNGKLLAPFMQTFTSISLPSISLLAWDVSKWLLVTPLIRSSSGTQAALTTAQAALMEPVE